MKIIARRPGTTGDFIAVDWLGQEPSGLTVQQPAVIGRFVARCQKRAKPGSTEGSSDGAGDIPVKLGWAGVSLVERKP